jgi:hypothetical protein
MFRFTTDDALTGERPEGVPEGVWEVARDITEENLHDSFVTFFVAENEADLADGGPVSEPVCCGGSLARAVADANLAVERRETPGGAVWVAPVNECGYRVDVLLLPDAGWLPADLRDALARKQAGKGGDDD